AGFVLHAGIPFFGNNKNWLLLRGVAGMTALFLFFYTLQNMPLASATTIQYLSPVFTVILAIFINRERVKQQKSTIWSTVSFFIYLCALLIITFFIMNNGTVKFFNDSKGYGFIKDTATDQEYFVHVSGLIDEVKENDEVSFDLKEGRKGLNAVNVKLV